MGRRSKKIMQKNMIVLFCLMLLFSPFGTAFTNMGGQVEAKGESIATEITDVDGLNDIRHNLAGNYVLVENIDLSQVDDWVAIGTVNEPFEGVFNWNGFKLVGIEKATVDDYENLFGVVADLASLVDIVVEDGNITENTDDETDNDIIKDIQIDENSEYSDVYAGDESEEGKIVPFFAPAGIQTTDEDEVEFAGGDGSKNNPFLIDDAHQLNKVREGLDKHYKLTANVNLDVDPYNEGSGWEPIGKATSGQQFLGSFDGNGYTISGLMIKRPTTDNTGLFGYTRVSEFKNVVLENVSVIGKSYVGSLIGYIGSGKITNSSVLGTVTGENNVGGLAGQAYVGMYTDNKSAVDVTGSENVGGLIGSALGYGTVNIITITDSHATGNVTGINSVGGLIGGNLAAGTLINSYATGNVEGASSVGGLIGTVGNNNDPAKIDKSYAMGSVEGTGNNVGGLVGNKVDGNLENTYARGSVTGGTHVGGLVGNDKKGTTKNSYATGLVTGTNSGGLIGTKDEATEVINSFYDQVTTGKSDTGKGTGKTTAEMKTHSTFTSWDLTNVWTVPGGEYPRFLKAGEVGTDADIIYVKEGSIGDGTSWGNAFGTLQDALDAAIGRKQIWIAAGTYIPTGNQSRDNDIRTRAFQMKNGVAIYGGFKGTEAELSERDWEANKTILSGDLNRNDDPNEPNSYEDNAYNVFYHPAGIGLNATAILDGVTITGGNANWQGSTFADGGAMNNYTASPTLKNITFEGNQSIRYGGAVSNRVKSNPTFENVLFRNNTGASRGGGLYNNASSPVLTNVIFIGNQTNGSGGGVFNEEAGKITLTDVTLSDNSAQLSGGGMYNQADAVQLTDVNFIENNAVTGSGGGLYLGSRVAAGNDDTLTNISFEGNTAGSDGGGMYNDNGTLTLTEGTFIGNKAQGTGSSGYGGGLSDNNSLQTELKDVHFEDNTAGRAGGGVSIRGATNKINTFILTDGEFHNNIANMFGGGLYAANSDTTMKQVVVTENKTTYDSSGFGSGGGGIATSSTGHVTLTLDHVDVSNNTSAWDAGGILSGTLYMKDSTVGNNKARSVGGLSFTQGSITNTTIDGNVTTGGNPGENTGGNAGGIFVGSGITSMENVTISNNKANGTLVGNSVAHGNGGGIYFSNNAKSNLINSKILNNEAYSGGGGFSDSPLSNGNIIVTNVLISGNQATYGAGWRAYQRDTFNNVTITNNHATHRGGGIDSYYGFNLNNSIVWGNSSAQATNDEICIDSHAPLSVEVNVNISSSLIDSFGKVVTDIEYTCDEARSVQHNGTTINPLFQADYRLSTGSPAIDAGTNNLIPDGVTTDLQGIARIINGRVDIGAYEYRDPTADKEIRSIVTEVNDQAVDLGTERNALNLPNKVDVKLDDGTTVELGINWDNGNPTYDKDVAGDYEFTGTLQLGSNIVNPDDLRLNLTVTVKEKEVISIKKIDSLNQITVNRGVAKSELNLPEKVKVQLSDGTEKQLAVTWNNGSPEFVENKPGTYTFTGDITLIDDIENSANLKASIKVNVNQTPFVFLLNDVQVVYANDLIQIKDRLARLKLPSDLPEGTKLEIKPVTSIDAPAGLTRAGDVLEFLFTYPAGSANYSGNFKLTLGVDNGMEPEKTGAYHYDETEKSWTYIDGRGQITNDTITLDVNHFSIYGVLADLAGPTDVTVTEKAKTKDSVTIKFTATDPSGIAKYVIYDNEDNELGEVTGETGEFTQNDLKPNTAYVYKVVAVDNLGNESTAKEVTVTTEKDTTNPGDGSVTPEPVTFTKMDELEDLTFKINSPESYYPRLAEEVTVYTSDGSSHTGKIQWQDNIHYDHYRIGTYVFTGMVTINGITVINSEDMVVTQNVIITEEQGGNEEPDDPSTGTDKEDPEDPSTGTDKEDPITSVESTEITLDSKESAVVEAGSLVTIRGTNASILLPNDLPKGTMLQVESVDIKGTKTNLKQAGEVYNFIFTFPAGFGFKDIKGEFVLTLGVNDNANSEKVAIYHYNEQTKVWDRLGGKVADGKISVTVEHFSMYGVFVAENEEGTVPSEPSKSTESSKENDDKKGPKVSIDSDDEKDPKVKVGLDAKSGTDKKKSLPKTATNYFTAIFGGLLLIVIGGGTYFIVRQRRTS